MACRTRRWRNPVRKKNKENEKYRWERGDGCKPSEGWETFSDLGNFKEEEGWTARKSETNLSCEIMVSAYPWHRLEGISSKAASYFLNKATMSTLEQKALWKICQSGSILNFYDIFFKLLWDNPGGVQCRLSVLIQLIDLNGGDSKYLHIVGVMGLRQLKRTFSSRYTHYIYSSSFTACVICSCLCSPVQQNQPNSCHLCHTGVPAPTVPCITTMNTQLLSLWLL